MLKLLGVDGLADGGGDSVVAVMVVVVAADGWVGVEVGGVAIASVSAGGVADVVAVTVADDDVCV